MKSRPLPLALALMFASESGAVDFRSLSSIETLEPGALVPLVSNSLKQHTADRTTELDAWLKGLVEQAQFQNFPNFPNFPNFNNFPNFANCFNGNWRNC